MELAYEKIVSQSFRARQKKGFRPGRSKRGERVKYEIPPSRLQKMKQIFDPSVTLASGARDMAMFVVIALWLAIAQPLTGAPMLLLFGYSVFRLVKKRKLRTPDGPWFGNSPVFGAVFQTIGCMAFAYFCGVSIANVVPWYEFGILTEQAKFFCFAVLCGPLNMFLK